MNVMIGSPAASVNETLHESEAPACGTPTPQPCAAPRTAGARLALAPWVSRSAPAVDERVQALVDEPPERTRPPGVHEVRMRAELAAGREREAVAAARRVAVDLRDRRHRDRMRRRAASAHRVGHVALVVGAVEAAAVPAAREADVQPEERAARLRAGRHRARRRRLPTSRRSSRRSRASPCGVVAVASPAIMRRLFGKVVHRGESAAAVVDRRGLAGGPAFAPCSSVGTQYAAVSARRGMHVVPLERSDPYVEDAFVERLPTKVWSCEAPARPGKTIGSSGARWLKRQFSTKLTPRRSARVTSLPHRLLACERGGAEQRGDDGQHSGRGDQEQCSHVDLPRMNDRIRLCAKSDTEALTFP